jgi:putative hemolysin
VNATAFDSVLPQLIPASLPGWIRAFLARVLKFDELAGTYARIRAETDLLSDALLRELGARYSITGQCRERIPKTGPAVIVANHPTGMLEGAVLVSLLRSIRGDVRFLANRMLASIPELSGLVIPVEVLEGPGARSVNLAGMRAALGHLVRGGLVVVFPAGEVSHYQWRAREVADPRWNPVAARLIALAARRGASPEAVPVNLTGSNSAWFHIAGMIHPRLRTAMLVRELMNKRAAVVEVRVGAPVPAQSLLKLPGDVARTDYLRRRTQLLASVPPKPWKAPVAEPAEAEPMRREIAALDAGRMLASSGVLEVYLAESSLIPHVLHEIGRLREVTFRAAGEGTGRALDLDRFDRHYLHLFVWNRQRSEVVGAYRIGTTAQDLYTATLFRFGDEFRRRLGDALELGRSFVRAEYQRSFSPLLLLWKGIGRFVSENPQYRILFGPVSISDAYQAASRELMLSYLERRATLDDWRRLVHARNAPPKPRLDAFCRDIEELSEIIGGLEPDRRGVPVLLRHYLKLGGKLVGFNIDPEFSNAVDGLILVDLTRTEPKLLARYLGKPEAKRFLAYQKGLYGTHEIVHLH